MRVRLASIFALLALANCAEFKAQQASFDQNANSNRINQDMARCDSYGYPRGTPDHANCMMKLDARRLNERQRSCEEAKAREKTNTGGGFGGGFARGMDKYEACKSL